MTMMSKRLLRALTDKARDAMRGIKTASILNTGSIAFRKYSLGSRKTQMTETTMPKSRCQRKGRVNGREGGIWKMKKRGRRRRRRIRNRRRRNEKVTIEKGKAVKENSVKGKTR